MYTSFNSAVEMSVQLEQGCLIFFSRQVDKSHAHAVDAAYYRDKRTDIGPLQVHERDCSGCTNRKIRCDIVPANISIVVEILAFEFTIDAEVSPNDSHLSHN